MPRKGNVFEEYANRVKRRIQMQRGMFDYRRVHAGSYDAVRDLSNRLQRYGEELQKNPETVKLGTELAHCGYAIYALQDSIDSDFSPDLSNSLRTLEQLPDLLSAGKNRSVYEDFRSYLRKHPGKGLNEKTLDSVMKGLNDQLELGLNFDTLKRPGDPVVEEAAQGQENPLDFEIRQDPEPGAHSASWWIKHCYQSNGKLYGEGPKNYSSLEADTLLKIMAVRSLANSVRKDKSQLLTTQLSADQIAEKARQIKQDTLSEGLGAFLAKVRTDRKLGKEVISAVTTGHGGGLEDLFSRHLAQTAEPGAPVCTSKMTRWMPTAKQRIEALQEMLRSGNLKEHQRRMALAEIIAARELTEARRGGAFSGADERLNRKLSPDALVNRARQVNECLGLLSPEKQELLLEKAVNGHGGAMLEDYKKWNTVKAHLTELRNRAAEDPDREYDGAVAMAIYANSKTPDKLLEETNVLATADALREQRCYLEYSGFSNRDMDLKNGEIGKLYEGYVDYAKQRGLAPEKAGLQLGQEAPRLQQNNAEKENGNGGILMQNN